MIIGERIRLRKVEREDLPSFVSWINEPEVRAGLALNLPVSSDEERSWYEEMIKRPAAEHTLAIDIAAEDTWRLIGSTSFFRFDWVSRSAEFGILLGDRNFWNQGYGTETTRLMIRHGFENLNLNRIFLRVFDTNPRARRVYEKAGFVHEGTLRQDRFTAGVYGDTHMMSILKSEWDPKG